MNKKVLLSFCLATALAVTGCKKVQAFVNQRLHKKTADAQQAATPVPAPVPVAAAVPTPAPAINRNAVTIALCYHNIEDKGSKALTIPVAEFEKEMQALKDSNFTVIRMQDFLAWRRGEKEIPAKCAIISIDDGWVSGYENAWPVLKKFGYPFTLFIYVNYVGTGGKSLSWDQLAEMRDAGVDIQCHTYSHADLRNPLRPGSVDKKTMGMIENDMKTLGMDGWMRKEIVGSKQVLEKQLGIKVNAIAYPFGNFNQKARDLVKEAGYEAGFTVYGQQLRFSSPPFDLLGRYAIDVGHPQVFYTDALKMIGGGVSGPPPAMPEVAQLAAASMVTQPMEGEKIADSKPLIKANLATMGDVDPNSIEMRISGLGLVPANFDPKTKIVSYQVTQKLHDKSYTVILSAKVQGKRAETKWSFDFDADGKAAEAPAKTP